ncbi:hypothetical protein HZA43_02325 [Candidatus Peregrinibacteria bacterium]|nr:hypothetical protein [Candidatus Peregrinibacteria bacterium]
MDPEAYAQAAREINKQLDGQGGGFHETPVERSDELSAALGFKDGGGVFLKNETGNVTGSHKGRHAMGTALYTNLQ